MYLDLSVGAKTRLTYLKSKFESHSRDYPHCPDYYKPKTWRDLRRTNFRNKISSLSSGRQGNSPVWYSHDDFFKRTKKLERHSWYTDVDFTEEVTAIVVNLSHDRWLAGYYWSSHGGQYVYYPELYTNEEEAEYAAREHAEKFGSECFADNQRELERSNRQDLLDEKLEEVKQAKAVLKMAYQVRHSGIVHEGITPVAVCRAEICKIRRANGKIAELQQELSEWDD